jgi:hypothetical protein
MTESPVNPTGGVARAKTIEDTVWLVGAHE